MCYLRVGDLRCYGIRADSSGSTRTGSKSITVNNSSSSSSRRSTSTRMCVIHVSRIDVVIVFVLVVPAVPEREQNQDRNP